MAVNSSTLRLASTFKLSDESLLNPESLPAAMYHNLWAPARLLLPAKFCVVRPSSDDGEGMCTLMSDGSVADLDVSGVHDPTPLWAREYDSSSLDALGRMLVRYNLSI